MRAVLLAAMLAAGTQVSADNPEDDDLRALIRAQQQQIEQLQLQLDATRSSLEALNQRVEANARSAEETSRKAEILADNLDKPPAVQPSSNTLGGYGELHFTMLDDQTSGDELNRADFHRFVMFYGHEFNDRLRFYSELEVEHSVSGDGEPGEVELEQAFVEYDWAAGQSLKAGVFLVPVGILNETHEPATFYGVERNPVEIYIIPTTWWEGGIAFSGSFADSMRYDFALHSGLFTSGSDDYAIRPARQEVANARFDSGASTGRLRWLGVPGLEVGVTVQYQDDVTQDTDPLAGSAWLYSGHLTWQFHSLGLRALYARWSLQGEGPKAIGADVQEGWYIEPSWRFNEHWGVFARYSNWDNRAGSPLDTDYAQTNLGANFWLHPNVVFKLDYQDQNAPPGRPELDGWNLGFGYQF